MVSIRFVIIAVLLVASFVALTKSYKGEKDSFQSKVEAVYKQVVPCLRLGGTLNGQYPLKYASDLEQHYQEMLNITAPYRGLPPHTGSGSYRGWCEDPLCIEFNDYSIPAANCSMRITSDFYTDAIF